MTSTLALVEIENVDEVSTVLGHESLELFFGEFEDRIGHLVRPQDDVVKVQPHKLCVLLRDVSDPLQIELAGAKLTRLFDPPIEIFDEEIKTTVLAAFVPPGEANLDTKTRLRIAEGGLRVARRDNKPYVVTGSVVEEPTAIAIKRKREIELAFDRGEFTMYFQPQIHAGYGNVIGAEGLMRWHDPKEGVRPPGDFIPYSDLDSMRALTGFAIKSSVAQCVHWDDGVTVGVNVSPVLLHDAQLIPTIRDALAIFGLAPERLTIEITEEAMIVDPVQALRVLAELHETGVRISIDDFGTGYSSLAYFRDLPADELKVDKSFVTHMLERPKDRDIVKAVIDLAHNFSMKVVAEGVEDEATAEALSALGADILQGYWFSKPVPDAEFRKLL